MLKYYNPEAIAELKRTRMISPYGFKYGFVKDFFKEDVYEELIRTFPDVSKFKLTDKPDSGGGRKRFYVGQVYSLVREWGSLYHMRNIPEIWMNVIKESASKELNDKLSDATGVPFNALLSFGFTYGDAGCMQEPHIDGAVRKDDKNPIHSAIAGLMYFNKEPGGITGTEVYDLDRKTVLFRVPDLRNSFFYFEQHPDSWHGFPTVPEGHDRRLVSITFSQGGGVAPVSESLLYHLFSPRRVKVFLKRVKNKVAKTLARS